MKAVVTSSSAQAIKSLTTQINIVEKLLSPQHKFWTELFEKLYANYEWDALRVVANQCVAELPKWEIGYLYKGIADGNRNNIEDAYPSLSKAIELNSKFARAYTLRGHVSAKMNDYDKAMADFDSAIQLDPTSVKPHHLRGKIHRLRKNYDKAMEDFNNAIQLDPSSENVYDYFHSRGSLKAELNDINGAILDFDLAILLNSHCEVAYYCRGEAKEKLGDFAGAIQDFDKIIESNQKDASVYNRRGISKQKFGDFKGAIRDYNKAIELSDIYENRFYDMAYCYGKLNLSQKSIDYYECYLENVPKSHAALNNMAIEYVKINNLQYALHCFEKASVLEPEIEYYKTNYHFINSHLTKNK